MIETTHGRGNEMAGWYWAQNGERHGPVSSQELKSLAVAGQLYPNDLVWREGLTEWIAAASVRGLFPEPAPHPTAPPFQAPPRNAGSEHPTPPPASYRPTSQTAPSPLAEPPRPGLAPGGSIPPGRSFPSNLGYPPHGPSNVPGAIPGSVTPPPGPVHPPFQSSAAEGAFDAARRHATQLFDDLRSLNFRQEVIPLDEGMLRQLAHSLVFWCTLVLGVIPLLITTINRFDYQLTGLSLFFALIWGFVLKSFIIRARGGWGLLVASLLLTGIVGINALLFLYRNIFPVAYVKLSMSPNGMVSLLGFIFQVGLCEELLKALPVIGYLLWKRRRADPFTALSIGVFSGLGFAAFENVSYNERAIVSTFELARDHGAQGLAVGVQGAMITALLRSLSLVFCHATWSGILAYFLVVASITHRRFAALFVLGTAIAAVLHGVYDWLASMQPTFAALIVALSYLLFFSYVLRLRQMVEGIGEPPSAVPAPVSPQFTSALQNGDALLRTADQRP